MSASILSPIQRIPWSKRADLQEATLDVHGRRTWSIKDPMTLNYFELRDEELFVLNLLNGHSTLDDVCSAFHVQFQPRTLSPAELQRFLGELISQGLVVSDGPGYGRVLAGRDCIAQIRGHWSRLSNVLAIRFRGIDPDRFLGWLLTCLNWMFSPWALALSVLLMVSAATLVTVQLETLISRLPDAQALLSATNVVWLIVLLGLVKVVHELGHGLACKYFGGECRELGVMLLVFMPTLYCNVSDIWMVHDKWKRIAVSLAGMWVEAVIAAGCTLLWWSSAPGLFHSVCLNLMLVCGVSTFLFNGNPLLRYDGYFVLADWLEIPNLQDQAAAAVRTWLTDFYCFAPEDRRSDVHRRWLLITYGVASTVYRTFLTLLILWSLTEWLRPYGLQPIAQIFAAYTISLMVLLPFAAAVRFLRLPATQSRIDWSRFAVRFLFTLAGLILLFSIPLPNRVVAGALLDQDAAESVYVTLDGNLVRGVNIGDELVAGDEIARLANPQIEDEIIRIEGQVNQHRVRLDQLEKRRIAEAEAALGIPAVREALRDFEQQLIQLRKSADRLVLRSPVSGVVLPAPRPGTVSTVGMLPSWTGSPLDPRNRNCFLSAGTRLCLVGAPASRAALVLISQEDINLVKVGQVVRIQWNELAGDVMSGQIVELSALDLDRLSADAMSRLNLPSRTVVSGGNRPAGTWYQARVRLDDTELPIVRGSAGQARIVTSPQSLWNRFRRWFRQTFPL